MLGAMTSFCEEVTRVTDSDKRCGGLGIYLWSLIIFESSWNPGRLISHKLHPRRLISHHERMSERRMC